MKMSHKNAALVQQRINCDGRTPAAGFLTSPFCNHGGRVNGTANFTRHVPRVRSWNRGSHLSHTFTLGQLFSHASAPCAFSERLFVAILLQMAITGERDWQAYGPCWSWSRFRAGKTRAAAKQRPSCQHTVLLTQLWQIGTVRWHSEGGKWIGS